MGDNKLIKEKIRIDHTQPDDQDFIKRVRIHTKKRSESVKPKLQNYDLQEKRQKMKNRKDFSFLTKVRNIKQLLYKSKHEFLRNLEGIETDIGDNLRSK